MKLYGRDWSRRDLEARVGRIEQIGGVRPFRGTEGPEAGVEYLQVRTGAGLAYTVLPSRGLDIGLAEFGGAPLTWLSPNGEPHPAYYDPAGLGWLRTAVGGLLMTCGLTQVGSPVVENGESFGLHGRAHHIPARQVAATSKWEGDDYLISISGQVEETSMFGPCLRLTRTVTTRLGENHLEIQDEVENLGFEPAPHMLLYHFNFGFPLMSEETQVSLPAAKVSGREPEVLRSGLSDWDSPQAGYQERVYYHEDLATDDHGYAQVNVHNPRFPQPNGPIPLTLSLTWDARTLPVLVQWKMPGQGMHVLGVEPANCHVEGRHAEKARGTLLTLQPGERREYYLKLQVFLE